MEKKTHSLKFLIISNSLKQVLFISNAFSGKTHDFTLFKTLFKEIDFGNLAIHVDLGFLGIKKLLSLAQVTIPYKASKLHPLTEEQKVQNCLFSRKRVAVENCIAGIKRYFILKIKNRMHKKKKLSWQLSYVLCSGMLNKPENTADKQIIKTLFIKKCYTNCMPSWFLCLLLVYRSSKLSCVMELPLASK